ncbi:hypothetical protein ACFZAV_20195 [Streptomyces sp. NPDC008343]|uniref:hypothetical protein n=1 Tax=Streptomyces sp. NPDC008343 TaxID=3364828 RepID=UPI0036F17B9D
MGLTLVKIAPPLLEEARRNPELINALFFDRDASALVPHGFRPGMDSHGEDFRALGDSAEGRAEVEEGESDWRSAYPWLARATGHGREVVEEYEFGYGPAFVLTPDEVRQIAEGLVGEGWARFLGLGPFYASAAAEGKGVIGGVN